MAAVDCIPQRVIKVGEETLTTVEIVMSTQD
jgi:hypothetical protein